MKTVLSLIILVFVFVAGGCREIDFFPQTPKKISKFRIADPTPAEGLPTETTPCTPSQESELLERMEQMRLADAEVYTRAVALCGYLDVIADLPVLTSAIAQQLPGTTGLRYACTSPQSVVEHVPDLQVFGSTCSVTFNKRERPLEVIDAGKNWPLLVRMMLWGGVEISSRPGSVYEHQAQFLTTPSIPGILRANDESRLAREWAVLQHIANDAYRLNQVGEALLPHTRQLCNGMSKGMVERWLPDFWRASYADMAKLEKTIHADEKRRGEEDVDSNGSYLLQHKLKLEGFFLRRWIEAGRGESGNDHLVVYRFWMARVARELDMPLADEWIAAVRKQVKASDLDKTWYLARL